MPPSRARRTMVLLDSASRFLDSERPIVVVKVGGSLLTSPRLIERVEWLLEQRVESRVLLICGGGSAADTVRWWQKLHQLSDETAHWLAFSAVTFNESLLHSALPASVIVETLEEVHAAWEADERPILGCEEFVRANEPLTEQPLPHDWDVTSDSIAAWCAAQIGADELILAKSTDLSDEVTVADAAGIGLVDRRFAAEAAGLRLFWTNLRADSPVVTEWQ